MPNKPAPSRRIETRAGNKSAHPGHVVKPRTCRTAAEVQAERDAKTQAKEDRELARKQSIGRAAQFETEDLIQENDFDVTPRPAFTPKLRPLPQINPFPAESSDIKMAEGSDFDGADFKPPTADGSVMVDDSAVESDPEPPVKKAKASSAVKGKAKVTKKAVGKVVSKKGNAESSDVEIVEPKVEPSKEPKPKLKKKLFQDEINVAAKEFEEAQGKKFGVMMKSMQGGEEPEGKPASKAGPSRPQATTAGNKRALKREGAIADINDLFGDEVIADKTPDQESRHSDQNGDT